MKNVNGLADAMRFVESACEKGEITIIGEGGIPTPVELYKKCVAYINEQYGVDILNLVLKEQKPCECTTAETDENEDEKVIIVNLGKVEGIVEKIICDNMSYLDEGLIDDLIKEIKSYYENIDGNILKNYDTDRAIDEVHDALANCIYLCYFDANHIGDIISKIVREVDENCISVK